MLFSRKRIHIDRFLFFGNSIRKRKKKERKRKTYLPYSICSPVMECAEYSVCDSLSFLANSKKSFSVTLSKGLSIIFKNTLMTYRNCFSVDTLQPFNPPFLCMFPTYFDLLIFKERKRPQKLII